MRQYIISEDRLLELIRKELELNALLAGGVDNWSWYYESFINYLDKDETEEDFDLDQEYDQLAFINLKKEFEDN